MRDFIIKDDVLEQCVENDSNVVIPEGVVGLDDDECYMTSIRDHEF